MVSVEGAEAWDAAARIVRRFAAATNLLIAGRSVHVIGERPPAASLRSLLGGLGARESSSPDYVFVVGPEAGGRVELMDVLPAFAGDRQRRIVVDATESDALGIPRDQPWREMRSGVAATTVDGAEVVLVHGTHGSHGSSAPATSDGRVATESRASATEPDGSPMREAALRIEWARRFMPVSRALADQLAAAGSVRGVRIGISMVLEPKTANLALMLREAGADVSVHAQPAETDDSVADALRQRGIPVDARAGADIAEARELALRFLDRSPQILLDDGSHLIRLAHRERPGLLHQMIGAAEETTSGLRPLREMAAAGTLRLPVVAVNDARTKTRFDNRYGTGQSCVFTILDLLTDLPATSADSHRGAVAGSLRDKTVVVAGFGPVGEGVAANAAALGARVVVAEIDPVRALEAVFAGYRTAPLLDAVRDADLVISATGIADTLSLGVLQACAEGAVLAVAGGVPGEIAIGAAVEAGAVRSTVGRKAETFVFPDGRSILILDDGGCINVTAGEGNPIEIMDLSFAVQLAAVGALASSALPDGSPLEPGVHLISDEADRQIAEIAVTALADQASPDGGRP